MIDLQSFFKLYRKHSPHHMAAINELMRQMPAELLSPDAEWVTIWNEEVNEWKYNED